MYDILYGERFFQIFTVDTEGKLTQIEQGGLKPDIKYFLL